MALELTIMFWGEPAQIGEFIQAVTVPDEAWTGKLWSYGRLNCADGTTMWLWSCAAKGIASYIAAMQLLAGSESEFVHTVGHLILLDCKHPDMFTYRKSELEQPWWDNPKTIGVLFEEGWTVEQIKDVVLSHLAPGVMLRGILPYDAYSIPYSTRDLVSALANEIYDEYEGFFGSES